MIVENIMWGSGQVKQEDVPVKRAMMIATKVNVADDRQRYPHGSFSIFGMAIVVVKCLFWQRDFSRSQGPAKTSQLHQKSRNRTLITISTK